MTLFDLFIIVIVALSALFAWVRGLTREVVTLIAIGAGILADLWFGGSFSALFGSGTIGPIIGYAVLFILVFLGVSITLELLLGRFLGRDPRLWDRLSGLVFGVVRGWLLLGLVYLALNIYFDQENPPEWIANSALKGPIVAAADLFEDLGLTSVATEDSATEDESTQTDPV